MLPQVELFALPSSELTLNMLLPHAIIAIDFGTECKSHLLSYRCYGYIR